jgi:divalent metal cation (Fe/Co/Zn/Cd) transporter
MRQGHNIAHEVEDAVLQQVPQIAEVLVHVKPEEELLTPSLKR